MSIAPGVNPMFAVATSTIATLPTLQLTEDEARLASALATRLFDQRPYLELRGLYYDGLQKMQDLGISIPPSLAGLRTIIGWGQVGVDALDERLEREGFRYPESTDTDEDLEDIWQSNNLDGESSLAHLDTLVYGRTYIVAGAGDDSTNGQPLITAESPLNMTALWDPRMRRVTAALQVYVDTDYTSDMYGQEVAALYLPGKTIQMGRAAQSPGSLASSANWEVTDSDNHGLGVVPVVRMANRQRLSNRDGLSEITPAWMNTIDSACRTLLGMEVGREFHAAPRRYVLGASEEAFKRPDGTPMTAWESYLDKMFMLERDEDGQVPTVGEFAAADPSTYTKLIDSYTKIMAGLTSLPPHFLGMVSDGNPASADAIRSSEARLVKRVEKKQVIFGEAWEDALRLALLIRDGSLPDKAHRIETDWVDAATPTPAATADALVKYIAAGSIPAASDVTLQRAGFSAVERSRLEQDRALDQGASFLQEIAHSLTAKAAKVDKSLEADASAPASSPAVAVPTPNVMPKKVPVSGAGN